MYLLMYVTYCYCYTINVNGNIRAKTYKSFPPLTRLPDADNLNCIQEQLVTAARTRPPTHERTQNTLPRSCTHKKYKV